MKIYTFRLRKRRLILVLCGVGLLLLLIFIFAGTRRSTAVSGAPVKLTGIDTNEERVALMEACGWSVESSPVLIQEVLLPETAEGVFAEYAALQQRQGLPLEKYMGKKARCYMYTVADGSEQDGKTATLLIAGGRVIGGDVTGNAAGSEMQPLLQTD